VQAGDERFELVDAQELDFVDEEGDPGLAFLGCFAERDEEVGEVVGEVAAVGGALERLDVDPGGDRSVGGDSD
jgi:hypothetical protein